MSYSVIALLSDPLQADAIISALEITGFSFHDISLLMPDLNGKFEPAKTTGQEPEKSGMEAHPQLDAPSAIGAAPAPGLGPFLGVGPFINDLSGAAAGGASGAIARGLAHLGVSEFQARECESKLEEGYILLAAQANNEEMAELARSIFESGDASNINAVGGPSAERKAG